MNRKQRNDIEIVGMDADKTHKYEGEMHHVYLTLSASPTSDWVDDFNDSWRNHFYMMKRHAQVEGAFIRADCPIDEVGGGLMGEIKKIMSEVNAREKQRVEHALAARDEAKRQDKEDREKIEEAAKRINTKN